MDTIKNNQFDADEITASGLTVTNASWVNAPMVGECFMNLECKFAWEKEIVPDDDHVILCLEIISKYVNSMSDESFAEWIQYLIATAERADLMGYSDHIVQILKK